MPCEAAALSRLTTAWYVASFMPYGRDVEDDTGEPKPLPVPPSGIGAACRAGATARAVPRIKVKRALRFIGASFRPDRPSRSTTHETGERLRDGVISVADRQPAEVRSAQGGPPVEFRILGPLEVAGDAGDVELGGKRQRTLLALLLLHANRVVPAWQLIDLVWDDDRPADAAKALQVLVSRLRRALASEDVVLTRPGGYLLQVDARSFDLARFEERAATGRRLLAAGDVSAGRRALADALAL